MNQETTQVFDINVIGDDSGNPYMGSFKVRTLLTRRQLAAADEVRRTFLGSNPESASAQTKMDGFIVGQLAVRIIDAPEWFKNAGLGGQDLPDSNVLDKILENALKAEDERKGKILKQADSASESLKKKVQK